MQENRCMETKKISNNSAPPPSLPHQGGGNVFPPPLVGGVRGGGRTVTKIRVGIGEGAVAKAPGIIIAEGLGSCVALVLYDIKQGVGGMAHILLPTSSEYKSRKSGVFSPYLYADTAIDALLKELRCQNGTLLPNVVAKIVGGARMFPVYNGIGTGIGEQNVTHIRHYLKKNLVPLASEDVGGNHGRSVEFHVHSGKIIVTAIGKEPREI